MPHDDESVGSQQHARRSSSSQNAHSSAAASGNRHSRRATRACDRCKQKKMRCTGQQPCTHCVNVRAACEYTAKYTRGKAPPIPNAHNIEPPGRQEEVPFAPDPLIDQQRDVTSPRSTGQVPSAEPGTGRRLGDALREDIEDGRSVEGGLYRTTRGSIDRGSSRGHSIPIHEYGDPPMPVADLSFLILPSPAHARLQIARYFNDVDPLDHFLHHGSVNEWFDDIFLSFRTGQAVDGCRQSIVLLVIASAVNHHELSSGDDDPSLSYRYFQCADDSLRKETGPIRLESVQARLMQCNFLLSRSRINQAWSIFGTVVNQIYAIGLNRQARNERAISENWINTECRKRTFWTAYNLDRYFALTLGRPKQFHDEDIDQAFPLMINDEHLSATNYMITSDVDKSNMKAQIYRAKMATILGEVIKDFHSLVPPSFEARVNFVKKYDRQSQGMLLESTSFMEQSDSTTPILIRRQIIEIKVRGAFMILVIHRSFLLDNPATVKGFSEELQTSYEDNVFQCLKAALAMTGLTTKFYEADRISAPSWFTQFCGFTAVVCLFVYVIKHQSEPEHTWMPLFRAAEKCQNLLKRNLEKGSFSQKCTGVLDKLHAEAMVRINGQSEPVEQEESSTNANDEALERSRAQLPRYSVNFAGTPAASSSRQPSGVPAITFGNEWRDANFDQTAPGGGILDSMDWIHKQKPSSVVDQIEKYGFLSLTDWSLNAEAERTGLATEPF